jgi:hypothetical protein
MHIEQTYWKIYEWDGVTTIFNIYDSDKYRRIDVKYHSYSGSLKSEISLRIYRHDGSKIEIGSEYWHGIKKILESLPNCKRITIKKYKGRAIIDSEAVNIISNVLKELKIIKRSRPRDLDLSEEEELEKKLRELGLV